MSSSQADGVTVELTRDEARLVLAALLRFEPYWPGDLDDLGRAELLAGIRSAVDHVRSTIDTAASTSAQADA
jgi:hypothetical protein